MEFYKKLKRTMERIGCKRSLAGPCLYFAWGAVLMTWLSWIDDCMHCGKKKYVEEFKDKLMNKLDCEDMGKLEEHVGCKIE